MEEYTSKSLRPYTEENVLNFIVLESDFFILENIPTCPNCPRTINKMYLKKPIIRYFKLKNTGSKKIAI